MDDPELESEEEADEGVKKKRKKSVRAPGGWRCLMSTVDG